MAVLYDRSIAVYDDSHQPTGGVKGFPPHFEMKKLRHNLYLKVEGPDDTSSAVNEAVNKAIRDGLIGAVAGAFASGGAGAIPAAFAAVQASLLESLGNQFTVSTYSDSNWIFWWT